MKNLLVPAVAFLMGLLIATSAPAQSNAARASANVDLAARLKEVEANPKLTEQLLKTGKSVAGFCANCHGDGGNSVKPDIPNLAGQNPAYLLDQLRKFSVGLRRNEFMEGMIKALTSDEKVGIVLFFSSQKVLSNPSRVDEQQLSNGKRIYTEVCWRCHGTDGHGNESFARIAGQQAPYLSATIKQYRSGVGTRTNALMNANTKILRDSDIDAVVAYVSHLQ